MEPFTVTDIAKLATQKFLESSAGELAKNFTPAAIAKINQLWQIIRQRFQGNSRREQVLTSIESGSSQDLNRLIVYLEDVMDENQEFAAQLQAIVREIKAGEQQGSMTMKVENSDNNTNYQNQIKAKTSNIGDNSTNYQVKEGTIIINNPPQTQPPDT